MKNAFVVPFAVAAALVLLSPLALADRDGVKDGRDSAGASRQADQSAPPQKRRVEHAQPAPPQEHRVQQSTPQQERRVQQASPRLERRIERVQPREHAAVRRVERLEHGEGRYRSPYWELDTRFRHDHYYPRRGSVVNVLPPDYFSVEYAGGQFYFQGGVWFRNWGVGFVVTDPPPGILIPMLPPAYTTVWLDSMPYYYADGVYYAPAPAAPGYVVVEPPPGIDSATTVPPPGYAPAIVPPPPPQGAAMAVETEPLFVYPRSGQSEAETLADRNDCDRWATEQTGYDPGSGDLQRRSNYQRAMSACLEGRGYTVK